MKILVLDIETAPSTVLAWGMFKQNIALNQILKPGYTMCFAAKWVGQKKTEFWSESDGDMVLRAWELLDEADAVVHFNGKRFDIPTLQREFVKADLPPTSPFHEIDLLTTVRRKFRFLSNKMDFVCRELGLGAKTQHTGMQLWTECMAGDPAAWKLMEEYNRQDVNLTERLYEKLLPWIHNHPNWKLYVDDDNLVCPNCGSDNVIKKGIQHTRTRSYQRYRCMQCFKPLRSNKCVKPAKTILI